jgi:hypothetical protein
VKVREFKMPARRAQKRMPSVHDLVAFHAHQGNRARAVHSTVSRFEIDRDEGMLEINSAELGVTVHGGIPSWRVIPFI